MILIKIVAVVGIVCCLGIGILFAWYVKTTNEILKADEKEIATLKKQLKQEKQREKIQIIDIQDGRNPKFGGF